MALTITILLPSCEGCEGINDFFATNGEEDRQIRHTLWLADSLMEENPDTAYALLRRDSAMIQKTGKAERMRFALLKTQAEDKLYIPHKSDSIMMEVASYYEKHGSARQEAQAYYMLGRVCHNLSNISSATSAFMQTLEIKANNDSAVYCIQSKAAIWLASICELNGLHEHSLQYGQKAYDCARLAGDRRMEAYTLLAIGRSYCYLHRAKKAVDYYLQAIGVAEHLCDTTLYNSVNIELSAVYIDANMAEKARQSLSCLMGDSALWETLPFNYNWGLYYKHTGKLDSTIIYFKRYLAMSPLSEKGGISLEIAKVYKEMGNKEKSLEYQELSRMYADSLQQQKLVEARDNAKNVEEKIEIQKNHQVISQRLIFTYTLIVGLLIILILVIYQARLHLKRQKKKMDDNSYREKRYWAHLRERDKTKIRESNEQVKQLEKELAFQAEEKRTIPTTSYDVAQTDNIDFEELSRKNDLLRSTSIYKQFHRKEFVPSRKDYKTLEDTLNNTFSNFTHRLRHLYPAISENEIRICCLLKIGLDLKRICSLLSMSPSSLSMSRRRLYKKLFLLEGKPSDFDKAIENF